MQGVPNPKAIHSFFFLRKKAIRSSKAVGEPPFLLGSAVLFAIKDAIFAARAEEGHLDWFPLDNPATPERIRMACFDPITKKFAGVDYRPKLRPYLVLLLITLVAKVPNTLTKKTKIV